MITSKPANGTTQDKKSFTAFQLIGQVDFQADLVPSSDRGIAQGGFQRSGLKSLLRGEPRCWRRGGVPARPGFPRRGNGKGEIGFLAAAGRFRSRPVTISP